MRRLFGTIGLTCLTVLAVAFYFNWAWILFSVAAVITIGAGIWLKLKRNPYAWTVLTAGCSALCAVGFLILYTNIIFQPIIDISLLK